MQLPSFSASFQLLTRNFATPAQRPTSSLRRSAWVPFPHFASFLGLLRLRWWQILLEWSAFWPLEGPRTLFNGALFEVAEAANGESSD